MVRKGLLWLGALCVIFTLLGCSQENQVRKRVNLYYRALIGQQYDEVYALLSPDAQKGYSEAHGVVDAYDFANKASRLKGFLIGGYNITQITLGDNRAKVVISVLRPEMMEGEGDKWETVQSNWSKGENGLWYCDDVAEY